MPSTTCTKHVATVTCKDKTSAGQLLASKAQYLSTYGTSILLIACGLLSYRLANYYFDETAFAQYALMKRSISFLIPMLILGLAVGIAKNVAGVSASSQRIIEAPMYLFGGVILATFSSTAWFIAAYWAPNKLSYLCTGSEENHMLVRSLSWLLLGLLLNACCVAYLRGKLSIGSANGLQLLNLGLVPIALIPLTKKPETFFSLAGYTTCIISLVTLFFLLASKAKAACFPTSQTFKALIKASFPRVPGDLALYGLMAIPAVFAAHYYGIQSGGEVAYALSLLALTQQIVVAPSNLLLPEATSLLQRGEISRVRRRLTKIVLLTSICTATLVLFVELFAKWLVEFHLGSSTPEQILKIKAIIPAAIPFNFSVCVRGVVDAADDQPTMPRNCITALAVFCGAAILPWPTSWRIPSILIAFNMAIVSLAALAGFATLRVLKEHRKIPDSNFIAIETKNHAA